MENIVAGQPMVDGVDSYPVDRYTVQRGLFASPSPRINSDLYLKIGKGRGHRDRFSLTLGKGAVASTNTYFGRFAASYWQRWTVVTEVQVSFRIVASGRTKVRLVASDIAGHRRIIDGIEPSTDAVVTMGAPLDKFIDGGALWLEFEAIGGPLEVHELEWHVAAPASKRPVAIAICTFNRADDCANTVAALASDDVVLGGIDAIYVVDQGTDEVQSRPLFTEVAGKLGSKLHYLQQPNLGGAGGFTRGLYEVSATSSLADVILMDDDILCEPETVLRLSAFANLTTEPTLVGAQMLFLLNPDFLNVGAEDVNLMTLQHGQRVSKALSNTSMLKKNQERRVDAGYNAWWTCLIPAEVVAEIGLPLPIFFQWDDVEYGVRAREAGFVTVTMPNAAVWHADFYWKDFDDWARYFSTRNSLIVSSLHAGLDPKALRTQFFRQISEYIVGMQYGLAHTTLKGIEDFLDGPVALEDGGRRALAEIRKQRGDYPETKMHAPANAPLRSADISVQRAGGEPSMMRLILVKRALDQWFGRTVPGLKGVTREDAHWWHIAKFDHVAVTDASQSGIRVRQRDKAEIRRLLVRLFRVLRRLPKELPSVSERYRSAAPQLISRENWKRLFES